MNMKREEDTVEVYAKLLAAELAQKHGLREHAMVLELAFMQGAMYGLKRGEEIATQDIIGNFSRQIAGTLRG